MRFIPLVPGVSVSWPSFSRGGSTHATPALDRRSRAFSPGCRNHRLAEFRNAAGKQALGTGGQGEADRIGSILGYIWLTREPW